MDDNKIIELYFCRDERAISETLEKYKKYCEAIACNIIGNKEDSEECVNASMLDVWNSIPPNKPISLSVYIARIVKNNALNIYKRLTAQKRGGVGYDEVLEELTELSADFSVEKLTEQREIISAVNDYLNTLTDKKRKTFVLRYWYCCEVSEIAEVLELSEVNVYNILKRERKRLANYLRKRGVTG